MGGRLIHQQEIGWIEEKLDECRRDFSPPTEHLDLFVNVIPSEKEGSQDGASMLFGDGLLGIQGFFDQGCSG